MSDHEEPAAAAAAYDHDDNEDDDKNDDDAISLASAHSDASMAQPLAPAYEKANSLSFSMLCRRLELLWQQKRKKGKRLPEIEKKKYILPSPLLKALEPESIFPLLRLLLPDIDNSRNCFMKEKLIAQAYCEAEGFAKGTKNSDMLYQFTDPHKVPHQLAGDLSLVVEHVLTQRIPMTPSKLTIGHINQLLEDLVSLRKNQPQHNSSSSHEWRNQPQDQDATAKEEKPTPKIKLNTLRQQWLRKCMSKGLSPLEHKWLVRILLKKLEFGLGWRAILSWYSPYAMSLWNAHNSLKNTCDTLADPNYTLERQAQEEYQRQAQQQGTAASRWQPPSQPAALGNTISPMLSNRVNFSNCVTQLHGNHTEYLKQTAGSSGGNSSTYIPLALLFPTVSVELKVDGERMIVHVQEDGIVTMHTRQGKWYSQLYSPVLGPAIRRAVHGTTSKYHNSKVILDGEVVSWDQGREQLIPFGSNRTVATYRRLHLYRQGLLDPRDMNLHTSTTSSSTTSSSTTDNGAATAADTSTTNQMRVMQAADETRFTKVDDEDTDAGKECWLQFIVFDMLYVDGPDATKLFVDCGLPDETPGSILHLSGFQRKKLLHCLLQEQPTEVELVQAVVVRSNGLCTSAQEYFSTTTDDNNNPLMECGHAVTDLDATQTAIHGKIPNIEVLDRQRRNGKTNAEIGRLRVQAIDKFYRAVVEIHRMEGIVLKDLAAPYIFGSESRSRRYWHKFKPDYEQKAVDMDVVILGAYFATGLRNSGRLSHFLVGCRDSEDHSAFMTLCNVNGGSVSYAQLDSILAFTGFQRATEDQDMQLGKWFQEEEHGTLLPNFISSRSLQRDPEDRAGWKFSRNKNYPDLWIDPVGELVVVVLSLFQVHNYLIPCFANPFLTAFHSLFLDSVVLTIYGQELVPSAEYSAGLSLRFARIDKIRMDADEKDASQVDTEYDLWQIYMENFKQRQESTGMMDTFSLPQGADGDAAPYSFRFLTPKEYGRTTKAKKRKRKTGASPAKVPVVKERASSALKGVSVTSLEGSYYLDPDSLDAQEAQDQGWLDMGAQIRSKEQVMEFILLHGGTIHVAAEGNEDLIIGGRETDARVVHYMKGIEYARSQNIQKPKTKKQMQLQKMGQQVGVLKWTFVYSLVHKWLAERSKASHQGGGESPDDEDDDELSIKTSRPHMLQPKKHDYLVRSNIKDEIFLRDEIFSLDNPKEVSMIDLRRALQGLQENKADNAKEEPSVSWQYSATASLKASERWILACSHQPLWPYQSEEKLEEDCSPMVVYADLLQKGFEVVAEEEVIKEVSARMDIDRSLNTGREEACDRIQSCLPLLRAMGGLVTPHLHSGVTHILCDLIDDVHIINLVDIDAESFRDPTRGGAILTHLQNARRESEGGKQTLFISPMWIRRKWTST
jgi:hypothetical protein